MIARPAVLRSSFDPTSGTISLDLEAAPGSDTAIADQARLALTSIVQLTPTDGTRLVSRLGTYHELAPARPRAGQPVWRIDAMALSHRPNHAGDGPVSAYVIAADGSTSPVDVEPMHRIGDLAPHVELHVERDTVIGDDLGDSGLLPLLPYPLSLTIDDPRPSHHTAVWSSGPDVAVEAWAAVSGLEQRARGTAALDAGNGAAVECRLDATLDAEQYRIAVAGDLVEVTAAGPSGFRHAFVTLTQWLAAGLPTVAAIDDRPHWTWRVLHIDLARQWFEPEVVERLIDVAAWRKLSYLHLHLTDDEGWRFDVDDFPALSDAATRGHGRTLPPMLGGGPDPVGRTYTAAEIGRWVARADQLGVVLVPEVDFPAHVHAVLAALPELRDPDDRSGATSVQYFVDNVLVPGHPATQRFVACVAASLADLFPNSPFVHIGGDEVPEGAWRASPIVTALRADAGLTSTRQVEASFHRQLVGLLAEHHGRRVGAWQEAAESGGVAPHDGYVVGWRTIEASRRLAALGYDVIVSPGDAYYLDMAIDARWETPGVSWSGATSLDDVCAFEPDAGWTDGERAHLLGLQACLWTEHVHDQAAMYSMLFPRLDAIAERAWAGSVAGGSRSLRARSERVRESLR